MKYRLKKDLPFAKAGSEVLLSESTPDLTWYIINTQLNVKAEPIVLGFIGDKESEDEWIEEVKEPREFTLLLGDYEIIKVREVL